MIDFGRIITAMITPFNAQGDVDLDEAVRLGEHLVATGTTTILLTGTTGESPTLTHDEEFELYQRFVSHFKGKALIMAGTGSNSTQTAVASTKRAEEIGVDATLQVVPYYNKPCQEGMYQHFKTVSEATSLPVMLYNIPGRTGTNMLPDTMARLAEIANVIGVKEAAGDAAQVAEIHAKTPDDFVIYSGDDALTLDFMANGATGVVSVAAHCAGSMIEQMINLFVSGDEAGARKMESKLMELFKVLFVSPNPTPVKAALRHMGFAVGGPRLPLVDVTSEVDSQVYSALKTLALV